MKKDTTSATDTTDLARCNAPGCGWRYWGGEECPQHPKTGNEGFPSEATDIGSLEQQDRDVAAETVRMLRAADPAFEDHEELLAMMFGKHRLRSVRSTDYATVREALHRLLMVLPPSAIELCRDEIEAAQRALGTSQKRSEG